MKNLLVLLSALSILWAGPVAASDVSCGESYDCQCECPYGGCGDWLVRLRAIHLWPNDSSDALSTVAGTGVTVGSATVPELDFTYMMTDNWALELILATSRHSIRGDKGLSGTEIATGWLLPPTLLLQYHFFPCCRLRPYVGAGVNFTLTYSEASKLANTKVKLNNSWGVAGQIGADWWFSDCWFLNFDAKYVTLDLTATLTGATAGTVDFDVNPWIFGVGIGRSF